MQEISASCVGNRPVINEKGLKCEVVLTLSSMTSAAELFLVVKLRATSPNILLYFSVVGFYNILKFGQMGPRICIRVPDLHFNNDVATMSSPCFPGSPAADLSVRVWPRQQLELQASFTRFRSGMLCHSLTAEKYRKIKTDSI